MWSGEDTVLPVEDISNITHYVVVSELPYCQNKLKPVRNECQKKVERPDSKIKNPPRMFIFQFLL